MDDDRRPIRILPASLPLLVPLTLSLLTLLVIFRARSPAAFRVLLVLWLAWVLFQAGRWTARRLKK